MAAATPAELAGIWEGTVGDLPIRACFVDREWGPFGAYYYRSHRRLIPLEAEDSHRAFREGASPDSPRWVIYLIDQHGRLHVQWSGGGRRLSVRLSRVSATVGEEGPCASLAFHAPRLEGVRTVASRATQEGVAYTRIVLDTRERFDVGVETFALDGAGEAVGRINAALAEGLAGDPPSWIGCIQDSLRTGPHEGGLDETLTPVMISRRWLSVAHHWDGYCGGAHPDSSNTWRLFELATGREIDLHDWFNDTAVSREHLDEVDADIVTVRPALRETILAGWRAADSECDGVVESAEYWSIGLTRAGFAFSPSLPHVAQACGDEFVVPFDRLRPLLTDAGAEQVRALSEEVTVRR